MCGKRRIRKEVEQKEVFAQPRVPEVRTGEC